MPSSVIVAAIASTSVTVGMAGTVFFSFSMSSFVSSLVLSGLSSALASGQKQQDPGQQPSSIANSGRTVTIRQPIVPWRIIYGQVRIGGAVTYKKVTDSNRYYHLIITLAGHVSEEIGDIWFGDEVVPLDGDGNATGKYAGYVRVKKSLGAEAGQPFADLVTESGGEWTDADRQTGFTKIYVRVKGSNDLFPTGLPNITAVVKGRKVYDPRSGLTAWSDNPALCINDYLTNATWGVGAVYADEINETDLIASANICDEAVSLAAGGTEKRYTCNGEFVLTEKPVDIIGKLASSMAGHAVQIGATWNILAGAYEIPTIELDEGDLAGPIEWQALVSRRDNCNGAKGIYVAPENSYQPTDFPAYAPAAYLTEDNNERAWHDLELNFTNSGTMAQRLAKIEVLRTRQGLTVKFPGKLSCFRAQPGKTVMLTIARYGWNQKVFFVSGGTFSINADGTLGYALALRETASAVYDWTTAEEQGVDFAPNTDLGDAFTVATPSGLALTSGTADLLQAGDGTIISRIKAAWTAPTDAFVLERGEAQVQFKKSADSTWSDAPSVPFGVGPTWIAPVEDAVAYDVRVRFENSIGVRGSWATVSNHTVVGKTAAPSDVTGFTAQQQGDVVVFACDAVSDSDLDLVEVRLLDLGDTTWGNGIPKANILRGYTVTSAAIPPGTWTMLAAAKDTSGNYSTNPTRYDITVSADGYTTIRSAEASPDWPGTLTNFVRHWTGVLVPNNIVTAGSYSGNEWIDSFVPDPEATCTYEAAELDKGIDVPARIWGDIVSVLGPGETTGISNPKLQIDYKLAAGAYDGFEDWTIGTVPFRYVKGKIVLDTSIGVAKITGFALNIDREPVTEEKRGITVGAGGTAVTFDNAFHSTPMLTAHNDGGTPLLPTHGSDSATGTTLHLFNTAGSDVGGTGGYTAIGA